VDKKFEALIHDKIIFGKDGMLMVEYYYRHGTKPRWTEAKDRGFLSDISAVNALLAAIIISFILQLIIPNFTKTFYFDPKSLNWWMPITSIFLHSGIMHLFFNAYALAIFGPILERRIGRASFLSLFLVGGIAGAALYELTIIFGIASPMPALGASGAIYAILGAVAVLFPNLMVMLFGIIPLSMRQAALLWVVLELVGTFNPSSGIASAAHLGGILIGFLWGKWELRQNADLFAFFKI
jgi:membrane associated rhomboid family serine protease